MNFSCTSIINICSRVYSRRPLYLSARVCLSVQSVLRREHKYIFGFLACALFPWFILATLFQPVQNAQNFERYVRVFVATRKSMLRVLCHFVILFSFRAVLISPPISFSISVLCVCGCGVDCGRLVDVESGTVSAAYIFVYGSAHGKEKKHNIYG